MTENKNSSLFLARIPKNLAEQGKVSEHISFSEFACKHCGKFPPLVPSSLSPEDKRYYTIQEGWWRAVEVLFSVFEELREWWGRPILVTSGYRCFEHQRELREKGYKAAQVSAHQIAALDITTNSIEDNKKLHKWLVENHPEARIGFRSYSGRIIHIDFVFEAPLQDLIAVGYLPASVRGRSLLSYWHPVARW